jgi:hypothetical protein
MLVIKLLGNVHVVFGGLGGVLHLLVFGRNLPGLLDSRETEGREQDTRKKEQGEGIWFHNPVV